METRGNRRLKTLRRYMNEYNNFPMRPLGWKSPNEFLSSFFSNV